MRPTLFRSWMSAALIAAILSLTAVSVRAQSPAEVLFKQKCAGCHGVDGKGEVPMGQRLGAHNLKSQEVQSQSDTQLTAVVTNGQNKKMPAYGGKLTTEQINDLIKYIRSLK